MDFVRPVGLLIESMLILSQAIGCLFKCRTLDILVAGAVANGPHIVGLLYKLEYKVHIACADLVPINLAGISFVIIESNMLAFLVVEGFLVVDDVIISTVC